MQKIHIPKTRPALKNWTAHPLLATLHRFTHKTQHKTSFHLSERPSPKPRDNSTTDQWSIDRRWGMIHGSRARRVRVRASAAQPRLARALLGKLALTAPLLFGVVRGLGGHFAPPVLFFGLVIWLCYVLSFDRSYMD